MAEDSENVVDSNFFYIAEENNLWILLIYDCYLFYNEPMFFVSVCF